jgi:hypothetical protein
MLGFEVSERTVSCLMPRRAPKPEDEVRVSGIDPATT